MLLNKRRRTNTFGLSDEPKSVEQEDAEQEEKHRLSSYEKYFEGYKTYRVARSRGKGKKTVREYVGTIYRQEMSSKQAVHHRILCGVLFAVSVAFLIAALYLNVKSNRSWIALAALIPLVAYGRLLLSLFTYCGSSRDLTIYEYKYGASQLSIRGRQSAGGLLILLAVSIVGYFIIGFSSMTELLRMAFLLIAFGIICLFCYSNKELKFEEVLSEKADKKEEA